MQNIIVEIDSTRVITKEGTSKKGAPYRFQEQPCIVHGCGRFPKESRVRVPDGAQPYEVGKYEVVELVDVGRFGFEISRDYWLTPIKPATSKAAA